MKICLFIAISLYVVTGFAQLKSFGDAEDTFETEAWSIPVAGYGTFTVFKEARGEPTNAPYHVRIVVGCSDPKQFLAQPLKPVMTSIEVCSLDKYEVKGDSLNLHMKSLVESGDSVKCVKKIENIKVRSHCNFYRAPDSVAPKKTKK